MKLDMYPDVTEKCFINAPFERLRTDLLDLFLDNRLQPEIGLEGESLWNLERDTFTRVAARFHDRGLACTLHAPFHDLVPGGFDSRLVEISREKLRRAFGLLEVFRPESIVCHLGYEADKHAGNPERWLEVAVNTWTPLLAMAEDQGVRVMFENTYEKGPQIHEKLFAALDNANVGFCMDTGHLLAFAGTGPEPWLERLGDKLGQLHLHDNNGATDGHLAVGEGVFDFAGLFTRLHACKLRPLLTLEPHSERDLQLTLANISRMGLFEGF